MRLHGIARLQLPGVGPWVLERKHAAIVAYLWLEGPTPRPRLAGLLWPQATEDRARGNLRQRLSKLREAGLLIGDERGVLSLPPGLDLDAAEPPGAPLLASLDYDDCEPFARWLDGQREAERAQRKRDWLARVRDAAQSMRLDDALFAADQLLQTDRESEEAYRVLMEVYYLRGDGAAAIAAWDRCKLMLRELYGVLPGAATRQLGQTILDAVASAGPASAAVPASMPITLLRPPRLIERRPLLPTLVSGWQGGRTLCVCGDAGLGKSRLLAEWVALIGPCVVAGARPGDRAVPYASLCRLMLAAIDRFELPMDSPDAIEASRDRKSVV